MGLGKSLKKTFKKALNIGTLGIFDDSAEKEAKRQRELLERQEQQRNEEEEFQKKVEGDVTTLEGQTSVKSGTPKTTVDFTKAIKSPEEEGNDKLKKAFKVLRA